MQALIRNTLFDKKSISDEVKKEYEFRQSNRSTEDLKSFFDVLDRRLLLIQPSIKQIFTQWFNNSGKKVIDDTGATLKIAIPSYEKEIEQFTKNTMKDIRDISKANKKSISKAITKGIKEGNTFDQIGNDIVNDVDKITKNRAVRIARTESVKSHSVAMEKTLKENNIDHYNYLTSDDAKVSDICWTNSTGNKNGKGRPLIRHEVGKGPLPVKDSHPNCRCVVIAAL